MFKVVEDGVVGHWFRWHLLAAAGATLGCYIFIALFSFTVMILSDLFPTSMVAKLPLFKDILDPRALLLTIPYGILKGDRLYEKDRLANERKPLFEDKK